MILWPVFYQNIQKNDQNRVFLWVTKTVTGIHLIAKKCDEVLEVSMAHTKIIDMKNFMNIFRLNWKI